MEDIEKSLKGLESLLEDPTITATVDKARQLNDLIALYPMDAAEAEKAMNDLNAEWQEAGLKGDEMRVNGRAWSLDAPLDYAPDTEVSDTYYLQLVNQKTTVFGFSLLEKTTLGTDGVSTRQQVYLNGRTLVDDEEGVGGKTHTDILIALSPEDLAIYYKGISPQRAASWLEFYRPEHKADIDFISSESSDEAEAIMNLKEYRVTIEDTDKGSIKELRAHLDVYINEAIKTERHIPYLFKLVGDDTVRYVHMHRISAKKTHAKDQFEFYIYGITVGEDKKSLAPCLVPIGALERFESVRSIIESREHDET